MITNRGERVRNKTMIVLACGALLLSACGSRVDSDESSSGGLAGGGQTPATQAPDEGGGDGMFGTLEVPCRPGDTSSYPDQSEQGVTADTIRIATISDPGGPQPGLNQSLFDTMQAFADWCNELGGINGRTVQVDLLDAGILQYKEKVLEACDTAFAMVGGLGVLDYLGAQDAVDCGLINVPAATVSPQAAGADLMWQPLPNPPDSYAVGAARWVADNYPDAITKAGAVRGNLQTILTQSDRMIAAYEQEGFDFISEQTVNVAETNWAPFVLNLKNDGVEYLTATSTFEEVLPMLKVMNEQGYQPTIMEYETNFYDDQFPEGATAQGIDVGDAVVRLTTWPFEEADERPAMAEYLRILDASTGQYDTDPAQLGVQAFSAALLFATAVDSLGADVTRDGLAEALSAIHEWDGGGLHGESDPGAGISSNCFIMMQIVEDGFERRYPLPDEDAEVYEAGDGQACPADARVELPEFGGLGATAG